MTMNLRNSCSIGAVVALVWCLGGCGDSGPETIPVYGTVSFPGRDFPYECRLFFRPGEDAGIVRPVISTPDSSGSYETRAFRDSKGLLPGTYYVEVAYFDLKPGHEPVRESSFFEKNFDAGELLVESGSGDIKFDIEVPNES